MFREPTAASSFEMTLSSDLPRFEAPPVIETVLGVYFRPLHRMNSVEQGIFWSNVLQSDFPFYELRPPLESIVERFDDPTTRVPSVRWQVSNEPDTPRLWAKSVTGEHILQIQRDGLLANWLRKDGYLPFRERLEALQRRLAEFEDFVRGRNFDQPITPTSCTVTYINHIPATAWSTAIEQTLACWTGQFSDSWLRPVEQGRLQLSFAYPDAPGRLHVTASSVVERETKQLMLQLELTARVMLATDSGDQASARLALETGHEWVVRGFASMTTPEMHKLWRRVK
jgi:uncharacterized protein (TIGR04255 family)